MCGKHAIMESKCCFPLRGRSNVSPSPTLFKISLYSVSLTGIHCEGSQIAHIAEMQRAVPSVYATFFCSSQK